MTQLERTMTEINDLFLDGDTNAAVLRCAAIFNNRDSDYELVVSALALMRNHGSYEQWAKWAGTLNERDWGVPTELTPVPYPFRDKPFDGSERSFHRLGIFVRGGQAGKGLALNPIKTVTLDDAGIKLDRRFGSESIAWTEITAGKLISERTKSMADLVGLPGIRRTLVLERTGNESIELDVSTCTREFDFPLQLLAAIETRIDVTRESPDGAATTTTS